MKAKKILASILLAICLLSCSQDKIVELPLTIQNGYGHFSASFGGIHADSEDENNPWKKTYLRISKFPEGLSDMKCGHIETNIYQSVYQDYFCGNITSNWYENLQKLWLWEPDTLNLSKNPIKTKIAFVYGIDSEGILKIAVDANNNLDLSDDKLFVPLEASFDNVDSLAQVYAFNVSFETFVHNEVVPVSVLRFWLCILVKRTCSFVTFRNMQQPNIKECKYPFLQMILQIYPTKKLMLLSLQT